MTLFAPNPGPTPRRIRRILIANRGEIALRILRACRAMGIETVAIHADCDREALHVRQADQAFALEGNSPADTYLNAGKILAIAARAGADALHPGYGFLSERADFAAAVQGAGLIWIGPDPDVIAALGDKIAARALAASVGAPLVAGSAGPVTADQARAFAQTHGLPIAIKAAHGGGGRGLRVVRRLEEVAAQFDSATREAEAAFGRGDCFVEQFLDQPRHIEAQVLADAYGKVKVLGTRDCSLQRRNQKLVEEAPAPFLPADVTARVIASAQAICRKAGYRGAGTVEFLLSSQGVLSFLEVNTRLQVEHPVTEEVTGIDLVCAMIRVAEGAALQDEATPAPRGHAIEFRINAEDPGRGFLPTPGRVTRWQVPGGPGVRVESGVTAGDVVPPEFDSLMAKLIVTGATRDEALARAAQALAEFEIEGVASVLPFHRAVVVHPDFARDFKVHTGWIAAEFRADLPGQPRVPPAESPALWRGEIEIDGRRHRIALPLALLGGVAPAMAPPPDRLPADPALGAPMAGRLLRWLCPDGAEVAAGEAIAVLEAMKMETRIEAPGPGRLQHLAAEGSILAFGDALARITQA